MKSPKPYPRLKAPEDKCVPADAKQRGELSELAFLHRASELGFVVSKPYGDNQPYDFIVDVGPRNRGRSLFRVQVKSTAHMKDDRYHVKCQFCQKGGTAIYSVAECDIIAVHIIPEDGWYILPVDKIPPRDQLVLAARNCLRQGINGKYREAWHLLARG